MVVDHPLHETNVRVDVHGLPEGGRLLGCEGAGRLTGARLAARWLAVGSCALAGGAATSATVARAAERGKPPEIGPWEIFMRGTTLVRWVAMDKGGKGHRVPRWPGARLTF